MRQGILITVICCLSFVAAVLVSAYTFKYRNRADDMIVVTGLAKQDFDSDLAVWTGHYEVHNSTLKGAYDQLKKDAEAVRTFLAEKGIADNELQLSSAAIQKEYEQVAAGNEKVVSRFIGYQLSQTVRVESMTIDKVEALARDVSSVIDKGVEMYSNSPEYYYTKIGDLKIEMIAQASKDGHLRAEQIAKNATGKIGNLRYSSLGVFNIARPNSNTETSWAGNFDTSSRRKTASVTIKLQFAAN